MDFSTPQADLGSSPIALPSYNSNGTQSTLGDGDEGYPTALYPNVRLAVFIFASSFPIPIKTRQYRRGNTSSTAYSESKIN